MGWVLRQTAVGMFDLGHFYIGRIILGEKWKVGSGNVGDAFSTAALPFRWQVDVEHCF